jgi:hypothetical protein
VVIQVYTTSKIPYSLISFYLHFSFRHWLSDDCDEEESMINSSSQSSSGHSSNGRHDKDSERSTTLQIQTLNREPRIIMNPQARIIKKPKISKDTPSSSSTSE